MDRIIDMNGFPKAARQLFSRNTAMNVIRVLDASLSPQGDVGFVDSMLLAGLSARHTYTNFKAAVTKAALRPKVGGPAGRHKSEPAPVHE